MSDPVDPEVLDRACHAAWKACWPEFPHRPGSTGDRHIRRALESAGPIIAAAAYRQGREDLLARIEAKARNHDKWAEIDEKASRTTEDDHFKSESFSMRAAHHRIRAEVLRSLLTDKEGE